MRFRGGRIVVGLVTAAAIGVLAGACSHMPTQERTPGAELQARLEMLLAGDAFRGVQAGISVRSLDPLATLVAIHADDMMTPASVVKTLTSGASLALLGPNYAFITRLIYTGALDEHGVLDGDLIVLGGGDPTFPRTHSGGLSLDVYEIWADILRALGFRRIDGRIIAVEGFFEDERLGLGWCWDDLGSPFSAEVSGLNFADNCVKVFVAAGNEAESPARMWVWPGTRHVSVENQVLTVKAGGPDSVSIRRLPCENRIVCKGTIPVDGPTVTEKVAVVDPGLHAGIVLEEVLEAAEIEVRGKSVSLANGVFSSDTTWVTEHVSPPLWEIIKRVNKDSDNLSAESLLRTLGRELGDQGSVHSGLTAVRDFAYSCGIDSSGMILVDGSGLSRLNALSAEAMTEFLACYASSDLFGDFYQSLSIAAVDGTLEGRFVGTPAAGVLRGKSGSMTGVAALAGYSVDRRGDQVVFCIVLNGYRADRGSLVDLVDLLALEISEFLPETTHLSLR